MVKRLKNPTVETLDNEFRNIENDESCDAVFIYYGGHGVEEGNKLNAVLMAGNGAENTNRIRYRLEHVIL